MVLLLQLEEAEHPPATGLQSGQDGRAAWIQHTRLNHWALSKSRCSMSQPSGSPIIPDFLPRKGLHAFRHSIWKQPGNTFRPKQCKAHSDIAVYCWTEHKDGCALSNGLRTGTLPSALPFSLPFPREQESSGSRLVVQSGVMVTLENISLY